VTTWSELIAVNLTCSVDVTSSKNSTRTADWRCADGDRLLVDWSLMLQQFVAIVVKRCYYVRRNWRALFSQILLPALFVCVAMTVALTAPQVTHRSSL